MVRQSFSMCERIHVLPAFSEEASSGRVKARRSRKSLVGERVLSIIAARSAEINELAHINTCIYPFNLCRTIFKTQLKL